MIVEDDADARWLLSEVLHDAGFDVTAVAHGQDAIDLLDGGLAPCVILVDRHMPVMDGERLVRALANTAHASIPIVLLSADPMGVRPAGVRVVLRKPVDSVGLIGVLEQYCAHRVDRLP